MNYIGEELRPTLKETWSNEMLEIRAIDEGDASWLFANTERLFNGQTIVSRGVVHDMLDKPGFIAIRDGTPVGVAMYDLIGNNCELVSIEILEQWQGIGTRLIERLESHVRDLGANKLWLITTNDNLDAMRFYQKRGFRLSAVHPGSLAASRLLKPRIPLTGHYGIAMTDEVEFEKAL